MKTFDELQLSPQLNQALSMMDFKTPTPIQAKAIPLALKGCDILGSAQTGTGKTAAFSIPLIEALLRSPYGSALVLTPTRELAKQVLDAIHELLGPAREIKTAFLIGGDSMGKQMSQLRANPRIVVGTPGRINDHLRRRSLSLEDTNFLVLDETDRMLDMGFGVQLDEIVKYLPDERQTLMFSATLPKEIIGISNKYLDNPQRVSVGDTNVVALNIKQDVIRINQQDKYDELINQLHDRNGSVIVFVKTKHGADKMAKNLRRDGLTADALHGDLRQNKRDKVMNKFRKQSFRILVATDIAARGLDVPHIEHVINYDLPQVAEDYIHRIGRTARAGAEGAALCFISPQDGGKWRAIEVLLNPELAANGNGSHSKRGNSKSRRRSSNDRYKSDDNRGGQFRGKPKSGRWEKSDRPERADNRGGQFRGKPRSDRSDRPSRDGSQFKGSGSRGRFSGSAGRNSKPQGGSNSRPNKVA